MYPSHDLWDRDEGDPSWPPHSPPIETLSPQLLEDVKKSPTTSPEEAAAFRYLWDPEVYQACTLDRIKKWPRSDVTPKVANLLMAHHLARHTDNPKSIGYIFLKPEPRKKRFRIIHDTLGPNVRCAKPPNPNFATVRIVTDGVYAGYYAATVDWKCFFYQIALHPDVQDFFTFEVNGIHYAFNRLPMGFTWSVVITIAITRYLASGLPGATFVDTYVDNTLIVGLTKADVLRALNELLRRAKTYNVTVGEVTHGHTVTHRGMELDFLNKTVRATSSAVTKLLDRNARNVGTWGHWRSLISSVFNIMAIYGTPLGTFPHLAKYLSKHALTDPRTPVSPWDQFLHEWDSAIDMIRRNTPVHPRRPSLAGPIVITDARLDTQATVLAAILITTNGDVETATWHLDPKGHEINQLEAMAFDKAIDRWPHHFNDAVVTHLIDNTAAMCAIHHGHTPAFRLNVVATRTATKQQRLNFDIISLYVPSLHNPADALTRDCEFSAEHRAVLDWAVRNALQASKWVERARGVFLFNGLP